MNLVEATSQFPSGRTGEPVRVWENPSQEQMKHLLSKFGNLRGFLVWSQDKLVVWDANAALHADMEALCPEEEGDKLVFDRGGGIELSLRDGYGGDVTEEELIDTLQYVGEHPRVVRAMGKIVTPEFFAF